jgi:hypothetical protein
MTFKRSASFISSCPTIAVKGKTGRDAATRAFESAAMCGFGLCVGRVVI